MPKANLDRKQRGDSKLKNLPADVQDALVKKLEEGKLKEARAWLLAEHKVSSSLSALSSYLPWGKATRDLRSMAGTADAVKEWLMQAGASEEDSIQKAGNIFAMLTTGSGDAETFCKVVNTLRGWVETQSRIARADRKEQREEKSQPASSTLTPAEKSAKIREAFGMTAAPEQKKK